MLEGWGVAGSRARGAVCGEVFGEKEGDRNRDDGGGGGMEEGIGMLAGGIWDSERNGVCGFRYHDGVLYDCLCLLFIYYLENEAMY